MRQSMGATWIFSIVLTFIMIFTAYLAVTVNYAKAFKIKNNIIAMIEKNEGVSGNNLFINMDNYLTSNGYDSYGNCNSYIDSDDNEWRSITDIDPNIDIYPNKTHTKNGVCIYYKDAVADDFCDRRYYRVVTFFDFDLPYIGNMLTFSVKGNTSPIYDLANQNCIR